MNAVAYADKNTTSLDAPFATYIHRVKLHVHSTLMLCQSIYVGRQIKLAIRPSLLCIVRQ